MASDDVNKDELVERARKAAKRAADAAHAAEAADLKAADAAREAEYDADHSSAAAVHEAAHLASAKASEAHEAAERAKEAAKEARQAVERAEEAEDEATAAVAAEEADAAADRAEAAAREAEAASQEAAKQERAADEAKLKHDEERGYGEEHVEEGALHHEKRPALYLAEYDTPEACMRAAQRVRDAGYQEWDVHTPYPVHGMEKAMGLKETRLGWISMAAGMTGLAVAVFMIYWMNASNWDLLGFEGYPIVVGGKPPGAFPSMVPIMFELSILLTGFGTLLGMLHLIRLPRHHHPVFESARFEAASDDKFFISIETVDPKFDAEETRQLLESTNPAHVELVEEEVS
ncbi:MAG: DUF3341 domain-containing protein [Myxococcota bacterium]